MRQGIWLAFSAFIVLGAVLVGAGQEGSLVRSDLVMPSEPATLVPVAKPLPTVAGPTPFSVTFDERELTSTAAKSFPQTFGGVTASDPVVRIVPGSVRLSATTRVLFGTAPIVIAATPYVTDGRLDVRVDSAKVAGIELPASTRTAIADSVRAALVPLVPAKTRVDGVAMGTGDITLRGVTLP